MATDPRAQAYEWAGPGRHLDVDVIATRLHANEPAYLHSLRPLTYGACGDCWLRAGRAVAALVDAGSLAATTPKTTPGAQP